jgi:hypothetical protein
LQKKAVTMNVRLLGFDAQKEKYEECLKRLGCTPVHGDLPQGEVGLTLVRHVQALSDVKLHVQSLSHVFVQHHSLSSSDLRALRKLAGEAGVQVHFSAPTLYRWSIPDLAALLCDVKFVQVYKDYESAMPLLISDLRNEILAAACSVRIKISRAERVRSIVPCDFEVLGLRVEFFSAASAYFWLGSAAFTARHELRLFGSKGMAVVDVLKCETRIKTLDGNFFTTPFLSENESEEKELADFVSNLRRGIPAFVSGAEAETLRTVEEKMSNG